MAEENHKLEIVEVIQNLDYHSYVPEFLPSRVQETLHDLIDEFNLTKAFRLLFVVYGYIIIRRTYVNYMKRKQIADQLKADNLRKERGEDSVPEEAASSAVEKAKDDGSWGWGKSTRRSVKQKEAIFQEKLKALQEEEIDTAYDPDSDRDIEDLLED